MLYNNISRQCTLYQLKFGITFIRHAQSQMIGKLNKLACWHVPGITFIRLKVKWLENQIILKVF